MELKHLQAFVKLAEMMHFGRTARRLGISQSTLSTQIRALEEDVGGALINRNNRTLTLTPLGDTFLEDCQRILTTVEAARRNANDILSGTATTLRMGVCSATLSSGLFAKLLHESRRRFPGMQLHAIEAPPSTLAKDLVEGRIDCMVSITYGVRFDDRVTTIPMAADPACLIASESLSLFDETNQLDLERLKEHTFIFYENRYDAPHVVDSTLSFHPNKIIRLQSLKLIFEYIREGIGLAIIPASDTRNLESSIRVIPIKDVTMPIDAVRLSQSRSPTLLRFFEMLRDLAQNHPSDGHFTT